MTTTRLNQKESVRALAAYLTVKYSEAARLLKNSEYAVITEDKATEKVVKSITNKLWELDFKVLATYSPNIKSIGKKAWERLAALSGEALNPVILEFLTDGCDDLDCLCDDMIERVGYGKLLGDGTEAVHTDDDDVLPFDLVGSFVIIKN